LLAHQDKAEVTNGVAGDLIIVGGVRQVSAQLRRAKRPNFAPIVNYHCWQHDHTSRPI